MWRALLPLLLSPAFAVGASERYRFDRPHSQVYVEVSHLGFSTSLGRFTGIDGWFAFDAEDWSASGCAVEIDVTGFDLGDARWNRRVQGRAWLDGQRHPRATFRCDRVESTAPGQGILHGTLTLRGVARPLSLSLRLNRIGFHKYALAHGAGFSAEGTLKRSDFGLDRYLPEVGDSVRLRIEVEGIRDGGRDGTAQ